MSKAILELFVMPGRLAVARLATDSPLPDWACGSGLWSVTKTTDELSIVCQADRIPDGIQKQGVFRALKVAGPLDFGLTGILAGLTKPLAEAGIAVFVISTYDTDYILVRDDRFDAAIKVLKTSSYAIVC